MALELKLLLGAITTAFYGLFMAAILSKHREIKRARSWASTTARILSARSEARKLSKRIGSGRGTIHDTEIRNFAAIRYAFEVAGRRVEGSRIGIGADLGNFQVAQTLKRYPPGADVTVYYDPKRPQDCVLERDLPDRLFEIAILAGTLVGVCGLLLISVGSGMFAWLLQLGALPARASAATFAGVIGLLAAGFGFALSRRGASTYHWPLAPGQIISSELERLDNLPLIDVNRPWRLRTVFRSRTVYTYRVAGITYKSDRTSFGAQSYASLRLLACCGAPRFSAGQAIDVLYDPATPEQAVLRRGAPGQFIVWAVAAADLAGAAHLAGML